MYHLNHFSVCSAVVLLVLTLLCSQFPELFHLAEPPIKQSLPVSPNSVFLQKKNRTLQFFNKKCNLGTALHWLTQCLLSPRRAAWRAALTSCRSAWSQRGQLGLRRERWLTASLGRACLPSRHVLGDRPPGQGLPPSHAG